MQIAKESEELLIKFPNAQVNPDEQRRLRAALYKPLLALSKIERARVVEIIIKTLRLDGEV